MVPEVADTLPTLDKTSWIVKIAYMFWQEDLPTQIDRCTLWQRFCLMFVPWVLVNLLAWVLGFIVLGVIAHIIWRTIAFLLIGQKLKYKYQGRDPDYPSAIIGNRIVEKVVILHYERKDIWWMNWSQFEKGFRCPILMILVILFTVGICYVVAVNVPDIYHSIVGYVHAVGSVAYGTVGWWGSALVALFAFVAASYLGKKGYGTFAATPSGAVVISHFKAWKDEHCTIYKLV